MGPKRQGALGSSAINRRRMGGVGTDDKGYVVSLLRLAWVQSGTLPAELGDLTYLRTLDIRGSLEGGIPKELGNLSHLSTLIINGSTGQQHPQ